MDEEKQPVEAHDVKPSAGEDEAVDTSAEKTDQTSASKEDVEKSEEENLYKQELKKLQADLRKTSGALKEERRLRKEAETRAKSKPENAEETGDEESPRYLTATDLEQALARREFNQELKGFTSDLDEQNLIRHHYEHSIIRTGNVEADLKMAAAIANQHVVEQAKKAQMEREASEARMTGFQSGQASRRQGRPAYETDPVQKGAAELLRKFGKRGEEAIKHL